MDTFQSSCFSSFFFILQSLPSCCETQEAPPPAWVWWGRLTATCGEKWRDSAAVFLSRPCLCVIQSQKHSFRSPVIEFNNQYLSFVSFRQTPCSYPPFPFGGEAMTTVATTPSHDALSRLIIRFDPLDAWWPNEAFSLWSAALSDRWEALGDLCSWLFLKVPRRTSWSGVFSCQKASALPAFSLKLNYTMI